MFEAGVRGLPARSYWGSGFRAVGFRAVGFRDIVTVYGEFTGRSVRWKMRWKLGVYKSYRAPSSTDNTYIQEIRVNGLDKWF